MRCLVDGSLWTWPSSPRADGAGGLYHALNRGNGRAPVFHKDADYGAFERLLAEGRARYEVQLFSYQPMPRHWHLVLRPNQDGEMSPFPHWVTATHTVRYHAHYRILGTGHVDQDVSGVSRSMTTRPIRRLPNWLANLNEPLTD